MVSEILNKLHEIKTFLNDQKQTKSLGSDCYKLIKEFKKSMQEDTQNNYYLEIEYNGKTLGITFKGLLHDKTTTQILSTSQAYEVYKNMYYKSINIIDYQNEKVI